MKINFILFFTLICTSVFGQDNESDGLFESSLTDVQTLLPRQINGSVSVIDGSWNETHADFEIQGPEGLNLSRRYKSDHKPIKSYALQKYLHCGNGWSFNHPSFLHIKKSKSHAEGVIEQEAYFHSSGGMTTGHTIELPPAVLNKQTVPLLLNQTKGVTNCSGSEMSARTNLHNTILFLEKGANRCIALGGSGRVSVFEWKPSQRNGNFAFLPLFERTPTGNLLHYQKNGICLSNISKNNYYNWLKFETSHRGSILQISTSDGRRGKYEFKVHIPKEEVHPSFTTHEEQEKYYEKRQELYLTKASFSHQADQTFEYNKDFQLTKRTTGETSFIETEYYAYGKNALDHIGHVQIDSLKDPRIGRVKQQKAPVGFDQAPVVTHRFVYHVKDEDSAGRTDVFDAKLRKTSYLYNDQHRLIAQEKFQGNSNYSPYSSEQYIWDDEISPSALVTLNHRLSADFQDWSCSLHPRKPPKLTPTPPSEPEKTVDEIFEDVMQDPSISRTVGNRKSLEEQIKEREETDQEGLFDSGEYIKKHQKKKKGNLIGKCFKDGLGNVRLARFFCYDSKGNIRLDQLFGNLTGRNPGIIKLDAKSKRPFLVDVDVYTKVYNYSNDHFNLLLEEKEENGRSIQYTYVPGTCLVASKRLFDRGSCILREFFEYDENTALKRIIKDDGSNEHHEDLTNVTYRRITYLHPSQEIPVGLPIRIDEKYLDLASGQEVLLKRTIQKYSKEGWMLKQEHYDSQEHLRYILSWKYDAHGNVISQTDALGNTIYKTYDIFDNLKEERGPRGETTYYTYDFSHRLIKKETICRGHVLSTCYTYDKLGNKTSMIDCFGNETKYEYDDFNRLVCTKYTSTLNENGLSIRPVERVDYDIFDRPIVAIDANGNRTCTSYNAYGKPIHIQYPDGTQESFEYNADGSLLKSVACNGTVTQYTRDSLGRILQECVFVPGQSPTVQSCTYKGSLLVSKTDAEGCTEFYLYDGAGRLISTVWENKRETIEYDVLSQIKCKKEYLENGQIRLTAFIYDLLGRVTEERVEDENGQVLTRTNCFYDAAGNKTAVIQESASGISQTLMEYDELNHMIKKIDPQGNQTVIHYNYRAKNESGQTVLEIVAIDVHGNSRHLIFNVHGRVAKTFRKNAFGALLSQEESFYDAVGNQTCRAFAIVEEGSVKDRIRAIWTYNSVGDPISQYDAFGTPEQKHTRFIYNNAGQKQHTIKPDGVILSYTYDTMGRLAELSSSDGSIHYAYSYNRNHDLLQIDDLINETQTKRTVDALGRLEQETLANGLKVSYQHDALDRLTHVELPDHSCIEYEYDCLFLRRILRKKEGEETKVHTYENYDLAGNLLQETCIDQAGTIDRSYDLCGRPLSIQSSYWSQTIPKYDALGRIGQYTVEDRGVATVHHFGYNDLDHLISEEGTFTHHYQTDSLSNRIKKDDVIYSINKLNQVLNQGKNQYIYDLNGNLTKKVCEGIETEYVYDALDRLIKVCKQGKEINYTYDALHRRLSKESEGIRTLFLYQGENEIGSLDDSGNVLQLRVLGSGIAAEIGAAVLLELEAETFAPLHDHNGNVTCLIEADSGKVRESYCYSAFGEEKIFDAEGKEIEDSINPWRYSSKRLDEETDLIFFGRRYYDREIGKWISSDPISYEDGPNLYAYLHHSPLNYYDAYGLSGEAYVQSCEVACNSPRYCNIDDWSESQDRQESSGISRYGFYDYAGTLVKSGLDPIEGARDASQQIQKICCSIWNNNATNDQMLQDVGLLGCQLLGVGLNFTGLGAAVRCGSVAVKATLASSRIVMNYVARKEISQVSTKLLSKATATVEQQVANKFFVKIAEKETTPCLNALSKAGQVHDRAGLTKAGRSLDKHGNRPDSPFPKATGNVASKNAQGQYHLDDILTHPDMKILRGERNDIQFYVPDGRGVKFFSDGSFKGFLNY